MKSFEKIKKQALNCIEFFKSLILIIYSISLVSLVLIGITEFFVTSITMGFIVAIAIKEIHNKEYYLFYYNNGLSKVKLIITSYLLTILLSTMLTTILIILKKLMF